MRRVTVKLVALLLMAILFASLNMIVVFAESTEVTENMIQIYETQYTDIGCFFDGYAVVADAGSTKIIDVNNIIFQLLSCQEHGNYREGIIPVFDGENVLLVRIGGSAVVVEDAKYASDFVGGKSLVMNVNGDCGLIDTTGHYLLECEYEDIIYDSSDVFFVCKDNVWQLATLKDGEVVLNAFVKSNVTNPVKDSTMQNIIASDGEHYGIISAENKLLVEFKYEYIYDLTGGVYAGINGKTTDLISVDGKVMATIEATLLGSYSEGKIPCYMNKKFCYINKDGKVVNEVAVSDTNSIGSYYEGLAVIQMEDGSYSYLAENGELATRYVWDYAARFARGYALVMDVVASDTVDGEYVRSWKIIDHNFNTVEKLNVEVYVNDAEEHTTDFSNGFIRTVDNETGKMGFAYTANTYALYDCQTNGHVNGNWIVDKEAEIGIAGEKHISCIKCGEVMETATIDPLPEGGETETNPTSPDDTTDDKNFTDSIADKIGVTSDQLLMIAGGSLAALILLIIVIAAIKRKRR